MLEIHVPKPLEAAKPKATKIAIGGAKEAGTGEAKSAEMPQMPQATQPAPQPEMAAH